MRKSLPIKRITTSYVYVDDIAFDEEKHDAARKFLGHVPSKADDEDIQQEFTHIIEHIPEHLPDVKITIMNL